MSARSTLKRIARVTAISIGSLVAFVLGTVTLVFAALLIPPVRAFTVKKGVEYTNENFLDGMTLRVKAVDRIDPWGVNVRGIELDDDKQRPFVRVPWVLVRLRPWSLIENTLRLTRVEVDGAEVHLYAPDPNEPPEPEEPPSEPSTFVVQAEYLRVRSATLYTSLGDRDVEAVIGTLVAGGQYGPKPAVALKEATIRAGADDEDLLKLRTTEGSWSAEDGGTIALQAIVAGRAPLLLRASVPGLDDMEPWPLKSAMLRIDNVDRHALDLFGLKDGLELKAPLSLALDAKVVDDERLEAKLKLRVGKVGRIALDARADDDSYALDVDISPMQLASVAGALPVLQVEGRLAARATHGKDMLPRKIELRWNGIEIDDGAVPPGVLRGALALPWVRLDSLTLRGLEEAFAIHGEYDLDRSRGKGEIKFNQLQLAAIEALQKRGVAGLLNGGLNASFTPPTIAAEGDLSLRNFAHPSAKLAYADMGVAIGGTTTTPQGHFKVKLEKLAASSLKLERLTADAQANPRTMTAKLDMQGPDTNVKAELGGQRTQSGLLRVQGIGRGQFKKREVRFDLRELTYGEEGLQVQELALFSGQQALRAQAKLDPENRLDAKLALADIDLESWSQLADVKGLTGKLGGEILVQGTTSTPRIDTRLQLQEVAYQAKVPINGTIELKGDLGTRRADLKVGLWSDEELGARIELSAALPKRPAALGDAAMLAQLHTDMSIYMPVDQVSALGGDQLAGLDGMLEAKIKADGTLADPHVDANITAALKLPEQEGDPVEALHLALEMDKADAKLNVWAKDEAGQLLTLDGQVSWPGGSPRAAIEHPAGWRTAKFYTQAKLSPRRFDTMQGVFAYFSKIYALDLPLRAGGEVTLSGKDGVLDGGAKLAATIYGDKLDGRCRLGAQSSVDVDAKLKQDRVELNLDVTTDGGGSVKGKVSSVLALNALENSEPVVGPARVTLEGKKVAIHRLPGLCNLAGGDADFKIDATGLGKQRPELAVNAKVLGLHAPENPPMDITANVQAGGKDAHLKTLLTSQNKNVGYIEAYVPLSYPNGTTTPTVLPDAPVKAKLQLDKLQLANVLAFTEALGRVAGTASANIDVSGKLNDPYPVGYVQLQDVNISIASLAQPFRNVDGRIEIKGRSVNIEKLTARDRGGKIVIDGFGTLRKDMTGEGGLYVEADKFPLRQQGTVVGELTMRARADAKIPQDLRAKAELKILDGRIWLTGDRGKSVQSLDAHPDVIYADEKQDEVAEQAVDQKPGGDGGITLGSFKMKTEQPLWLMHQDFGLQVGVDIALLQGENGPKLEGEATLVRGELKLLGKPFTLRKGAIRFTGDLPPDPELDIRAVYNPPRGQDLIVHVTGRGTSPQLEFSGAATNASEAVAVLTGLGANQRQSKSGAESDAAAQMAGIAADMTAGLLVMTARREFGDWVPMISVETGSGGQAKGASAGFDASKLIPEWLKGIAKGAYVEGTVGQQTERGGAVGVGVRLEIAMPRDIVTSMGYGPGPGWSTDVAWAP